MPGWNGDQCRDGMEINAGMEWRSMPGWNGDQCWNGIEINAGMEWRSMPGWNGDQCWNGIEINAGMEWKSMPGWNGDQCRDGMEINTGMEWKLKLKSVVQKTSKSPVSTATTEGRGGEGLTCNLSENSPSLVRAASL